MPLISPYFLDMNIFYSLRQLNQYVHFGLGGFLSLDNSRKVKSEHQGFREEQLLLSVKLRVHFHTVDLFSHCLMISQFHYLFHLVFVVTVVMLLLPDDVLI